MIRKTFALLVAVVAAVPASAGNLMLGPAKLHPSYDFKTSYEDNIYRVPRDINNTAVSGGGVRGSWIFDNKLGLAVEAPIGENQKLDLGYDATFENYTTQSKANDTINQSANGAYSYTGSKITAKASDDYLNTRDPQFSPTGNVANGALVTREAHWTNTGKVEGEYALGDKFYAGLDASNTQNRYLDRAGGATSLANLLNSSVDLFGGTAGYKVAPKTRVFGAVHGSVTHYTEHTRLDNHHDVSADFGVKGDLTAKLTGLVQTGFVYQKFDYDPANASRETVGRHWTAKAQLNYKPTDRCEFILTGSRASLDAATSGARYYVSSGANLAYNHKVTEKVTAGVNGGVSYDKYSENFTSGTESKSRRDDTYQVGAKVDYQAMEWLKLGASFTNIDRYSTFSRQYNYRDNVTAVTAGVLF